MASLSLMAKEFHSIAHGTVSTMQVWQDWLEMSAIAISNSTDLTQYNEREARYMEIVKRYSKEQLEKMAQLLAMLVMKLEEGPDDVLGKLFHELEMHNKWVGQFFTPYSVCRAMAEMLYGAALAAKVEEQGFVTVMDPAVGGGAMLIAFAESIQKRHLNYQNCLHVTGRDIDLRAVHMSYIQCSLLGIPAVIEHGNSLSNELWSKWYTPLHVLGGWSARLRQPAVQDEQEEEQQKPAPASIIIQAEQLTLF